jgi:hypothetical protein
LAEAVDIISIAQQLVPNTSGHNEFERAQLITSSSLLTNIPRLLLDEQIREKTPLCCPGGEQGL